MKQLTKGLKPKMLLTFLTIALLQTILFAQNDATSQSGTSTTTKSVTVTSPGDWYSSPWIWVAGAAVLILLLVAMLRRSGDDRATTTRTDRVTVTKTSISDDIA